MSDGPRAQLRSVLAEPGLAIVPGVPNALFAKLAERQGFPAVFTTGAGIANTVLGFPDLGLLTLTEMLTTTRQVVSAVSIPVIADADTGYGNHLNVTRTVQELEHAGVAAITLEDQVAPKRCGHFQGKQVVPVREMVEKVIAATMARSDPALVLIARTDAIACEGLDAALQRARAYVASGADVIFIEAPTTLDELSAIPDAVPAPCLVNVVEGGLTPMLSAAELERLGFKLALYANLATRVAARCVEEAFETLRREGSSASLVDQLQDWEDRQALAGLPRWEALDRAVAAAADAAAVTASAAAVQDSG